MGMFDYVKCERVLPDGFDGRGVEFQTKDFDCSMHTIEITADGQLIEHGWVWDGMVPREERTFPDEPEDSPLSLVGSMKHRDLPPERLDFHGVMQFYTTAGNVWREYSAKFTDGKLVEIKVEPA
jgi:hypothetical protein